MNFYKRFKKIFFRVLLGLCRDSQTVNYFLKKFLTDVSQVLGYFHYSFSTNDLVNKFIDNSNSYH